MWVTLSLNALVILAFLCICPLSESSHTTHPQTKTATETELEAEADEETHTRGDGLGPAVNWKDRHAHFMVEAEYGYWGSNDLHPLKTHMMKRGFAHESFGGWC